MLIFHNFLDVYQRVLSDKTISIMNSVKIDVFGETQLLAGVTLHIPFVSTQNNKFVAEA